MNILIFLIILIASFAVVRIGAVAFQLTGLEWTLAKFQALSCFTGTGFTTNEAEIITGHPQRRKIASILMVTGNAGLITLIATFANTLRADDYLSKMTLPFADQVIPSQFVPLLNLVLIVFFLWLFYKISIRSTLVKKFTDLFKKYLEKKHLVSPVSFEELLVSTGGYGISGILLTEKSPISGVSIKNTLLREHNVNLLAIERGNRTIANPPADMELLAGDRVICFGRLDNIRKQVLGE